MPTRRSELLIRIPRIIACLHHVLRNNVQILTLLVYHMCHVTEQFVEFADALLNIANLRFALDDQRFLKVDIVLVRKAGLLLLQLLLLLLLGAA